MERLHDRHALLRRRPVDGRGDERERVVAVDDVGSVLADEHGDLTVGGAVPDGSDEEREGTTKHAKGAKRC